MDKRLLLGLLLLVKAGIYPTEAAPALEFNRIVRVALMDFSTADNSNQSIRAAAEFTSLLQIALMDEPRIERVERDQIRLAKAEFALAEMKATGGVSSVRRGRMLRADWLVTGHFSTDDRERPTLSLQVIEARRTVGSVPTRKRLLDPLINERTPSAEEMLRRYDADKDGKLSAAELSVLAEKLRKE